MEKTDESSIWIKAEDTSTTSKPIIRLLSTGFYMLRENSKPNYFSPYLLLRLQEGGKRREANNVLCE